MDRSQPFIPAPPQCYSLGVNGTSHYHNMQYSTGTRLPRWFANHPPEVLLAAIDRMLARKAQSEVHQEEDR